MKRNLSVLGIILLVLAALWAFGKHSRLDNATGAQVCGFVSQADAERILGTLIGQPVPQSPGHGMGSGCAWSFKSSSGSYDASVDVGLGTHSAFGSSSVDPWSQENLGEVESNLGARPSNIDGLGDKALLFESPRQGPSQLWMQKGDTYVVFRMTGGSSAQLVSFAREFVTGVNSGPTPAIAQEDHDAADSSTHPTEVLPAGRSDLQPLTPGMKGFLWFLELAFGVYAVLVLIAAMVSAGLRARKPGADGRRIRMVHLAVALVAIGVFPAFMGIVGVHGVLDSFLYLPWATEELAGLLLVVLVLAGAIVSADIRASRHGAHRGAIWATHMIVALVAIGILPTYDYLGNAREQAELRQRVHFSSYGSPVTDVVFEPGHVGHQLDLAIADLSIPSKTAKARGGPETLEERAYDQLLASPNAAWTTDDMTGFASLKTRAETAYYGIPQGGPDRLLLLATWERQRANLPEAVALCRGDANYCGNILRQPVEQWCRNNPHACREQAQRPEFAEAARTIGAELSPP